MSCFWCQSKRHIGIHCKKRPKDVFEAYDIGFQKGYDKCSDEHASGAITYFKSKKR